MVPERNPGEEPDQLFKEFIVITGLNLLVNIVFHTFLFKMKVKEI